MGVLSQIFGRDTTKWYKVFDSEQEAAQRISLNKAVTIMIEDQKYCLARTIDGFYALDDACPHNKAPLSKGWCNAKGEIVCPWHNYQFDLKLGSETTGKGMEVNTYKVEIRPNGLFVGI